MSGDEERPTLITLLARLTTELGENHMYRVLERELHPKPTPDELDKAREEHCIDDELEIDEDALLSPSDTGYWISAWVWVPAPLCEECDEHHFLTVACNSDALANMARLNAKETPAREVL